MPIIRMIPTNYNIENARFFVNSRLLYPIAASIFEEDAAHIFVVQNMDEKTIGLIGYGYRTSTNLSDAGFFKAHWDVDFFVMEKEVDYADMFTLVNESIKDKYDTQILVDLSLISPLYLEPATNAFKNNKFHRCKSGMLIRDPRYIGKK